MAAEQAASCAITLTWPNKCLTSHFSAVRWYLSAQSRFPASPSRSVRCHWPGNSSCPPGGVQFRKWPCPPLAVQKCCPHLLPSFLRSGPREAAPSFLDLQRASWSQHGVLHCWHSPFRLQTAQSIQRQILGSCSGTASVSSLTAAFACAAGIPREGGCWWETAVPICPVPRKPRPVRDMKR